MRCSSSQTGNESGVCSPIKHNRVDNWFDERINFSRVFVNVPATASTSAFGRAMADRWRRTRADDEQSAAVKTDWRTTFRRGLVEIQGKPDFEEAMQRIEAWFNHEETDRP